MINNEYDLLLEVEEDIEDGERDIPFIHSKAVAPITLVGKVIQHVDDKKQYRILKLYHGRFYTIDLQDDFEESNCPMMEIITFICKGIYIIKN